MADVKPEMQFIVRKYVMAKSAEEAIRREKKIKPHDVFVDDDWKKENLNKNPVGFGQK